MLRLLQLPILALIVIGLSGCADAGKKEDPGTSGTVPVGSTHYASGEAAGVIQGVVTDDELVPIKAAKVTIVELDLAVMTGDGAEFEFRDLPLGSYRVHAFKLGFEEIYQTAHLKEANQTLKLELRLKPFVVLEPYHLTTTYTGKISCGIVLVPVCGVLQGQVVNPTEERWIFEWTYEAGVSQPLTMVTEIDWKPSVPGTAQKLYPAILIDGSIKQSTSGPSPIRMESDDTQMKTWFKARKQLGIYPELVDPVIDQRFTVHRTDFWNVPAPEGWSVYNTTQ